MLLLSWRIEEVDADAEGEPNDEGTTWRRFVLLLLTLLLDMDSSVGGLSSCREVHSVSFHRHGDESLYFFSSFSFSGVNTDTHFS